MFNRPDNRSGYYIQLRIYTEVIQEESSRLVQAGEQTLHIEVCIFGIRGVDGVSQIGHDEKRFLDEDGGPSLGFNIKDGVKAILTENLVLN